jgi:lysophospholipase L1-like esterase
MTTLNTNAPAQILVYADSLTWGLIPGTRERLRFDQRWPGVLETALLASAHPVRVIEDCLNGRRSVWEDPFKPGRKGLDGVGQRIEVNSPLALVILMLGTNDFQATHGNNAWLSAQGVAAVVAAIRQAPIEPGMPVPPILVVAPPPITTPKGTIAPKFEGAQHRCVGFAPALKDVALALGCEFFDAGTVVTSSTVDGVHLDAADHATLGLALQVPVARLIKNAT